MNSGYRQNVSRETFRHREGGQGDHPYAPLPRQEAGASWLVFLYADDDEAILCFWDSRCLRPMPVADPPDFLHRL